MRSARWLVAPLVLVLALTSCAYHRTISIQGRQCLGIGNGDTKGGTLGRGQDGSDGRYRECWRLFAGAFTAARNLRLRFIAASDEFQPVLHVYLERKPKKVIAISDAVRSGRCAVELPMKKGLYYLVVITTERPGARGEYLLRADWFKPD